MEANDDVAREPDAPSLEGELLEPSAPPAIGRPPGRKPVAPLHVVPPLTDEEVEILIADPGELLRRRAVHYLRWADSLVSESPSKINRVAFGVESQRRMIAHLLSISIPPSRPAIDGARRIAAHIRSGAFGDPPEPWPGPGLYERATTCDARPREPSRTRGSEAAVSHQYFVRSANRSPSAGAVW